MNLCVATLQPHNRNDSLIENLERAESYLDAAVKAGAKLVLCPEFLATGYIFENSLWDKAEPAEGITFEWLRAKARQHSIFIGASFLELKGEHYLNTFILVDPSGKEAGRVYKDHLPFYENYFCKAVSGSHIIECDLGKIGVGICFENQRRFLYNEFAKERPDLILMPHSAPAPLWHRFLEQAFTDCVLRVPQFFSDRFEVPVILSNKSGEVRSRTPLLPGIILPLRFIGGSTICNPENAQSITLGKEPGMLCETIELRRKGRPQLDTINRSFVMDLGTISKLGVPIISSIEGVGRLFYTYGPDRKRMARKGIDDNKKIERSRLAISDSI